MLKSYFYYILSNSLIRREFSTLLKLLNFSNKVVLFKNFSSIGSLAWRFCYTDLCIPYFYRLVKIWLFEDRFFVVVLEEFNLRAVSDVDWLLYFDLLGTDGNGKERLLS